jgi:hypothetical protein
MIDGRFEGSMLEVEREQCPILEKRRVAGVNWNVA